MSIITPFFNTRDVFHETARSVLGQSLQQWEWIIVNDGSTNEESLKVLDSYRTIDPRIRVIDLPENRGVSAARNIAIRSACSDFIFNIDSDDLIEPTAIEKHLWFLLSYPQFSFANSFIVGFGHQHYLWNSGFHDAERYLSENQSNPNGIFRRSLFFEVGFFEESTRLGLEDWEFWVKCANNGLWGGTIPEYLIWYRRRPDHSEKWPNWDKGRNQQFFREYLRKTYSKLWINGMIRVHKHNQSPYDVVSNDIPLENLLEGSRKRILMVVPWLELGGADKFNLDLLRELVLYHNFEVSIVTTLPSTHRWFHEFSRYTPDIFVLDHFLHTSDYPRFIRYLIRSRQIDTVMIANSEFGYLLLPYLRAYFPDVSFVDYLHMEEENWKNGGYPRLSLSNQSQLDLTVVSSCHLKRWMCDRGASSDHIFVCTTNIDPEEWNPQRYNRLLRHELGVDRGKTIILYAGRLTEQKQPLLAARILLELKRRGLPFVCLIAGDGPLFDQLTGFVEKEGLTEVRMLGAVGNERIRELMAVSDIFFLPSAHEGISLAIYEAMAMGLAIVGADVGGQAELVTPECGILVKRDSSEFTNYVQALQSLITNPQKRQEMGRCARERICAYYRLDQMGLRMVELFELAHRRRETRSVVPVDPSLAHEIAIRAVEMVRLQNLADYLWVERDRLLANNSLRSESPRHILLSLSRHYMMPRLYTVYVRIRRINPNLARTMRFLFFRLKDVIKKYVLS
ncbi:MAG: glycosyltransferase [Roseiflexus sp.]|uniref:glycosyltransferase n=1 Tax=Roseiflexus sp. TaxID=2562120 RepID=UPI0025FFFF61|nr:glycosyltransferase [Roseiflexus sp.]MCL6540388.1 glycosyltransferase [Roseiflexus sp.]